MSRRAPFAWSERLGVNEVSTPPAVSPPGARSAPGARARRGLPPNSPLNVGARARFGRRARGADEGGGVSGRKDHGDGARLAFLSSSSLSLARAPRASCSAPRARRRTLALEDDSDRPPGAPSVLFGCLCGARKDKGRASAQPRREQESSLCVSFVSGGKEGGVASRDYRRGRLRGSRVGAAARGKTRAVGICDARALGVFFVGGAAGGRRRGAPSRPAAADGACASRR
jgi:hypothetical protein